MINYDSPCVSICSLDVASDGTEYCVGCKRTSGEIFSWMTFTEEERLQKMDEIRNRNYNTGERNE
jgi:predicted Fe-S protein YdhL (DUF1289 family)